MNNHDKSNLQFILSLTPSEFEDWYECLDDDDIAYAMEILQQARTEVAMQLIAINDEPEDLNLANKVLAKFRLTK